ncbi:MAG: hypothetical protein WC966_01050 [Bradymonadales bacterium]
MSDGVNLMNSIRDRCKRMSELFDGTSFVGVLNYRALNYSQEQISLYSNALALDCITQDGRSYYHRGHMLLIYLLAKSSCIRWEPWESGHYDMEDILSRRAILCELQWDFIRNDAVVVNRLFSWLWDSDILRFSPSDAVHVKALIDQALDNIDSSGFLESLRVDGDGSGEYLLVRDLLAMQAEISHLLTLASDAGSDIPSIQHLTERNEKIAQWKDWLQLPQSPYLATPCREVLADERMAFLRTRNLLLIHEDWAELAKHYEENRHIFENELKSLARYYACLGRIYGERLNDNTQAAEYFAEAMNYDPSDFESFHRVKFYLREGQQWTRLVELLSNHWESYEDMQMRCEILMECAEIQAKELKQYEEGIGLFERAYTEGHASSHFESLFHIIQESSELPTNMRLRACVVLSGHISSMGDADRYVALSNQLMAEDENLDLAIKSLIHAGIQNYLATPIKALETLKEAIVQNPTISLYEGMLYRIFLKSLNYNELLLTFDDLSDEDIEQKNLAHIWLTLGRALLKLGNADDIAFRYLERSALNDSENSKTIELCLSISEKLQLIDKQWLYAMLLKEQSKSAAQRDALENRIQSLRLSIDDDDLKLCSSYEQMLSFPALRQNAAQELMQCIARVSDSEAILEMLQRVEARSLGGEDRELVEELYRSLLERELSQDVKRGVLERYLGFMLGQGDKLDRAHYIDIHAELLVLAPAERLLSVLRPINPSKDEYRAWTNSVEDKLRPQSDDQGKSKTYAILAEVYAKELEDSEKEAQSYEEILRFSPDNVEIFEKCIALHEGREQYYEALELIRERMPASLGIEERLKYYNRTAQAAMVSTNDYAMLAESLKLIADTSPSAFRTQLQALVAHASKSEVEPEQINSMLESVEGDDALAKQHFASLRLERAQLLANSGDLDGLAALLDERLKSALESSPTVALEAKELCNKLATHPSYNELREIWQLQAQKTQAQLSAPAIRAVETPTPAAQAGEALTAKSDTGAEIIASIKSLDTLEQSVAQIDAHLKTFTKPALAINFLKDCSLALEAINAMGAAENYLKRVFALDLNDPALPEFYKRRRQFKKALKIIQFRIAKEKNAELARDLQLEAALIEELAGDFSAANTRLQTLLKSLPPTTPKPVLVHIHRSLARLNTFCGDVPAAVESLKAAGLVADFKQKEEIDVDCAFLLRDLGRFEEARKLFLSLRIRGLNNERMTLLGLSFDIDEAKYADAQKKIDESMNAPEFAALKLPLLEQFLRLQQSRNEDSQALQETAKRILELDPDNRHALDVTADS